MSSAVSTKSAIMFCLITLLLIFSFPPFSIYAANDLRTGIIVTDDKAFPPFAFLDAAGNPQGITIDIWKLWSKKTGIPVRFDLKEWDEALKAVREGRADAVGGLFLTPERKAYLDYTTEIIRIPTSIFFHNQIAGIKNLKDLSGFSVGVIKGDSSEELLRTEHPDINLIVLASTDELVRAAIAGRIRVFVADEPVALFYLAKYQGGEAFRRSSREISINRQYSAVRKGNNLLLTKVQSGFDRISKAEINDIVTEWSGKSTRAAIPWREIGLIIIAIMIISTSVFVWNIQLRRRVLKATQNLEERNKELELSREAIRNSEERYRELVEHANSIILRMDKEGRILFFNEYALRFFGFQQEEVIGRNVVGTIVPQQETTGRDLAAMIKDIAVNPGAYTTNENENIRSDGRRVWIAWTNKAIYDDNGEVSEILCIGNDITDRKHAAEAVKQGEERFSKAFRSSPAPLLISEIDTGIFLDVNEAWVKMIGYTREEQVGRSSREVGIWLDPNERVRIIQKLKEQGFFREEPIAFIAKNGRHLRALWYAETITLGEKQVMLSMIYDETERKQSEDALRMGEERLNSVIEGTNVGTWEWNVQTGETVFNERWAEMVGYNLSELAPVSIKTWQDLAHPDDLEESDRQLAEVFDRKRSFYDIECRMKHRSGEWIWVHDRGKVISWTTDGRPGIMAGTHTDITERKKTEQQIIEYNQLLHSILAASPVGIGKIENRKIVWANDTLCRMSGYSERELQNLDPRLFYKNAEEHERVGRVLYEEGQVSTHLVLKDGTVRDALIQIAPTDSYSYIFSIVDITQQKKDAQELIKAQGLLNAAFMQSPSGILIADAPDVRIKMANPAALGIRGAEDNHLIDIDVALHSVRWQTLYPDGRPMPPEELPLSRAIIRGEICRNIEVIIRNENGDDRWVSANAAPVRNQDGHIIAGIVIFHDITEAKHMEAALRQSEEKFKAIFEESPFSIVLNDFHTGQFIDVNRAYAEIYQSHLRKDFIIGKTSLELGGFINVDDNKRVREKLANNGRVDFEEVRILDTGGVNRVLLISSRVIDIGGRKQVLTTLQDISERKKMEETLQSSFNEIQKAALRYEALISASNTGAWEYNNDLGYLWCSPEYFSMLGRDIAGFDLSGSRNLDQTWLDLLHPDDRQRAAAHFAAYLKNPSGMYEQYFRMLHKNGSWRWIWSRGKTLMDKESNRTEITVGTHIDITPNKNLEEELRRLSTAIEQAAEDIMITDPDGVIQYVNPAFEKITGYSRTEVIGRKPSILKSGMHEPAFYDDLWKTINDGEVWTGRIANRRKDNRIIYEDATISPLVTSSGNVTGYVALKRDVTDAVMLETQLRQAQKMEAIGTLAGGIAHDFNNMLGAMFGFAELARFKTTDESIYPYLEQILKACERSRDLVKQILTFSRQKEHERKPIMMVPLIKEVTKFMRSSLPASIEISQKLEIASDVIMADATEIHQLLMNLCTNAGFAMKEKGGLLEIVLNEVTVDSKNDILPSLVSGRYLQITVRDTGHGIEKGVLERIFEPYFTTKKTGEGTGLGLSVVDGIVKSHGGAIDVYSEVGKGSVFHVYLPLIEESAETKSKEDIKTLPGGSETILFVDDEETLTQVGKMLLEDVGYKVITETDPAKAIAIFRKNKDTFDLVITDKTMPHMTGFDLARAIRNIRADMPIIICSGFQDRDDLEKISALGMSCFINKPVQTSMMVKTVRNVLDKKK